MAMCSKMQVAPPKLQHPSPSPRVAQTAQAAWSLNAVRLAVMLAEGVSHGQMLTTLPAGWPAGGKTPCSHWVFQSL